LIKFLIIYYRICKKAGFFKSAAKADRAVKAGERRKRRGEGGRYGSLEISSGVTLFDSGKFNPT
jgi:hypothetical protein